MIIQLCELKAWNGTAEITLRYSTHTYITHRTDSEPDLAYAARIKTPIIFDRNAVAEGQTRGESSLSVGIIDLANADGELDDIIDYAYSGRSIKILQIEAGAAYSTAVLIFEGVLEQPQFNWSADGNNSINIIIRDKTYDLTRPVQNLIYLGNNSLPNGVEGVDDIGGKWKPLLFGYCAKISPPCVNTARLIYQVSSSAINTVSAVYDRSLALSKGADYATLADLQSIAPAASEFRVHPGSGMFRLGSTPAGLITCDAIEGSSANTRYPGELTKKVLLAAGFLLTDIDTNSLTALDIQFPYECGYWVTYESAVSSKSILDAITQSIGGWWGANKVSKISVGALDSPSSTPKLELHAGNLITLSRNQSKDSDKGIPPYKLLVGYARYWTVQNNDFAAAVPMAVRVDLQNEYRYVNSIDNAIKTAYPLSPEVNIDTLLRFKADAQLVANAKHLVIKNKKDTLQAEARDLDALTLDIGDVIKITLNRYKLNTGKLFRVIGSQFDPRIDSVKLTLWG